MNPNPPSKARIPLLAYPILWRPRRVARRLEQLRRTGRLARVPNVWQVALGVLRMVHRMLFRADTVGLCSDHPPRAGWRAKLFRPRPIRFPFLWSWRSVAPFDLSGLVSSDARLIRHLVGTHHDADQFVYDLEILSGSPGALERLRDETKRIVQEDTFYTRWMRDLVVYQNYHEILLETVEAALQKGIQLSAETRRNPDISLAAHLEWCADQPDTPGRTWRAWRNGDFRLTATGSYTEGEGT